MKKAVIYARVSTRDQSVELQLEELREFVRVGRIPNRVPRVRVTEGAQRISMT